MDLDRPALAEGLMQPDVLEDLPVGVRLTYQVVKGVDLVPVEMMMLVFQRAERAFADAVLAGASSAGPDMDELGACGDEPGEGGSLERRTVVGDQLDLPDLAGNGVGQLLDESGPPASRSASSRAIWTVVTASVPVQVGPMCQSNSYLE
ncbi:hypothetical protein FDG2_2435 [Candidatus Protofrankia californiensis]|uniref:Uncharacterized protein n=1 Tax=Candidatus Protofrankia californiensis TaxID=1839754 RepID=A0A1C3NXK4_9ACTN|nr:hypothetical protein FDG2_2435 [Candidatus Protofrankia californiensis]